MRGPRTRLASIGLALCAAACASPGATRTEVQVEPVVTAPARIEPARSEPARSEHSPVPAPAVLPGRDHRSAVACRSDADCGWDDPCRPTRCVEPGPPAACDESTPPPGACTCLAGSCTLKPNILPPPTGTCEPRACLVDRAAGRCVADGGEEGTRFNRPVDIGPSCDCIRPGEGCVFQWFDAVSCKTDRDCWTSPVPRRHPVARPKHLRKRDFRPCADSEVAPLCGPAGHCVVGPAYGC